ncbi:MAG: sugar phosphate isomerase [Flavobacteriaceae bacterium]|nr:sugar phosphate isomerase [Flavobacteriaceae bacterium]
MLANDVSQAFSYIRGWGLQSVEGGPNTYGLSETDFKALLDEFGLSLVSTGTDLNELQNNLEALVTRANFYGAKFAMVSWIDHQKPFSIEDADKAISIMNEAGRLLKKEDITLVYHPHGYEFSEHPSGGSLLDYMIRSANDFYFEMDTFWIQHGGGDPVAMLKQYPEAFKLMHLKDMKRGEVGDKSGSQDVNHNVVLGTGQIPIAELVAIGKKTGVQYFFIEDESDRVLGQVPRSLTYLGITDPDA